MKKLLFLRTGAATLAVSSAAAATDAPFPFMYWDQTSSSYYKTPCNQVVGRTNGYGTDPITTTETSLANWACVGGVCDPTPGGYAQSDYRLGYYRSTYSANLGTKYAYGGRCESIPKKLFSQSGVLEARFFIHSDVAASTGVSTIGLFPGDYSDVFSESELANKPSFWGGLTATEKANAADWRMSELEAFTRSFELDLAVVNLRADNTPLVKFGQPGNTFEVPLARLDGNWIRVVVEYFANSDPSWSHGAPSGWSDGTCHFKVFKGDHLEEDVLIQSCDLAPSQAWWLVEPAPEGGTRLRSGPGGSKLVINSRAREFDSSLVTVVTPGTTPVYDYSNDRSHITVDYVKWTPYTGQ